MSVEVLNWWWQGVVTDNVHHEGGGRTESGGKLGERKEIFKCVVKSLRQHSGSGMYDRGKLKGNYTFFGVLNINVNPNAGSNEQNLTLESANSGLALQWIRLV